MGKEADRREVERWLRRLPKALAGRGAQEAYLFGSWATGEADEMSDVDLIVVAPSERPFVDRFRDFPEALNAPTGVDLLVYTPDEFSRQRRENRFIRHVLGHAKRLI